MVKNRILLVLAFFVYIIIIALTFNLKLIVKDIDSYVDNYRVVAIAIFVLFTLLYSYLLKLGLASKRRLVVQPLDSDMGTETDTGLDSDASSDPDSDSYANTRSDGGSAIDVEQEIEQYRAVSPAHKSSLFDYESIINSADTFILVVDNKLTPVYINDFGRKRLGKIYRNEMTRIEDFTDSQFIDRLKSSFEEATPTFHLETSIRLAGKKRITVNVSVSKLVDSSDILLGMVIVFNDISKQKRAELSLNNQINFSKQIFKTIPDVILITDMDLRVIFANKKAESILEKSPDENRKIYNYLSKKSIENGFDEYLRQILTKGISDKQINVLNPFISKEGYVDIEIVPLKSDQKTIGGLMLVKDITEWRNLTDELKNLEQFNKRMISSSPYVIISVNENDIVSGWNRKGEEIFSVKENDIVGKNLFNQCPPLEMIKDEVNEAKIIGEPIFLSGREITLEENRKLFIEVTIFTVFTKEKNVVINIRDISKFKKMESSLAQAKQMGSLGLLTSKIVHDLNNVLSGITGYTTLLDKKVHESSELRRYINRLTASSVRAAEIIKQTLSYSKVDNLKGARININEIIRESAKLLRLRIGQSKVTLNLRENDLIIQGSKTRFSQAIINLLVNANDALSGRENPEIIITTTLSRKPDQGEMILISILDNGIGIKKEDQAKIFEPYFTTKKEDEGTGLGLSNVKDIIHELNGSIELNSEYGSGTEFILTLPRVADGTTKDSDVDLESAEKTELNISGKILLVDDEETVREIGTEILALLGINCVTAVDGEDGLAKYREMREEIDLVILDVEMPKVSGNVVFDEMRRIDPDQKILIASGYSKDHLEKHIFKKTIPDFIAKPFQLSELRIKLVEMGSRTK